MRTSTVKMFVGDWGDEFSNFVYRITRSRSSRGPELAVFDLKGEESPVRVLEQKWNAKLALLSCAVYFSSTGRLIWANLRLIDRNLIHFDFTYTQITTIWRSTPSTSQRPPSLAGIWKCGQSSLWYKIAGHKGGYKLLSAFDPIDQERAVVTQSRWMKRTKTLRFSAFLQSNQRKFAGEIETDGDDGAQLIYSSTCFEPMFRIDPASLAAAARSKPGEYLLRPVKVRAP